MLRTLLILPLLLALAPLAPAGEPPAGSPAGDGAAVAPVEEEERLTAERRQMREAFSGIGVEEQLGETIDLSTPFVDHRGRHVTLQDYVQGDVPLLITFVYHNCPMLCSLVLDGLTSTLRETTLTLGTEYRTLAISIDPNDTPELSGPAHERYARRVAEVGDPEAMTFLTGTQESIDRITGATGFRYEWVEDQQEFAHTATLVFVSPAGQITRYLYGIQYPPADVRRSLVEAGEGTIGSTLDQLFLYCFVYDPDKGGYVLHATNAMKLGALLTLIILAGSLLAFWRRESRVNEGRLAGGAWRHYEDPLRTAPLS
jgi:protein SCO1